MDFVELSFAAEYNVYIMADHSQLMWLCTLLARFHHLWVMHSLEKVSFYATVDLVLGAGY